MADIQFQEPAYARGQQPAGGRQSALTRLIISTGLAHDSAGAQKVLFVVLAIAIIGIIAVLVLGGSGAPLLPDPIPTTSI